MVQQHAMLLSPPETKPHSQVLAGLGLEMEQLRLSLSTSLEETVQQDNARKAQNAWPSFHCPSRHLDLSTVLLS